MMRKWICFVFALTIFGATLSGCGETKVLRIKKNLAIPQSRYLVFQVEGSEMQIRRVEEKGEVVMLIIESHASSLITNFGKLVTEVGNEQIDSYIKRRNQEKEDLDKIYNQ